VDVDAQQQRTPASSIFPFRVLAASTEAVTAFLCPDRSKPLPTLVSLHHGYPVPSFFLEGQGAIIVKVLGLWFGYFTPLFLLTTWRGFPPAPGGISLGFPLAIRYQTQEAIPRSEFSTDLHGLTHAGNVPGEERHRDHLTAGFLNTDHVKGPTLAGLAFLHLDHLATQFELIHRSASFPACAGNPSRRSWLSDLMLWRVWRINSQFQEFFYTWENFP